MSISKWYLPAVTIWPPWGDACWCSCWLWAFCAQATCRLIAIGLKTNVSPTTVHIQLCQRIVSPLLRFRGNKHSNVSVHQGAQTPTHPPRSPPFLLECQSPRRPQRACDCSSKRPTESSTD